MTTYTQFVDDSGQPVYYDTSVEGGSGPVNPALGSAIISGGGEGGPVSSFFGGAPVGTVPTQEYKPRPKYGEEGWKPFEYSTSGVGGGSDPLGGLKTEFLQDEFRGFGANYGNIFPRIEAFMNWARENNLPDFVKFATDRFGRIGTAGTGLPLGETTMNLLQQGGYGGNIPAEGLFNAVLDEYLALPEVQAKADDVQKYRFSQEQVDAATGPAMLNASGVNNAAKAAKGTFWDEYGMPITMMAAIAMPAIMGALSPAAAGGAAAAEGAAGATGLASLPAAGTWAQTALPALGAGAGTWSAPAALAGLTGTVGVTGGLGAALAAGNAALDASAGLGGMGFGTSGGMPALSSGPALSPSYNAADPFGAGYGGNAFDYAPLQDVGAGMGAPSPGLSTPALSAPSTTPGFFDSVVNNLTNLDPRKLGMNVGKQAAMQLATGGEIDPKSLLKGAAFGALIPSVGGALDTTVASNLGIDLPVEAYNNALGALARGGGLRDVLLAGGAGAAGPIAGNFAKGLGLGDSVAQGVGSGVASLIGSGGDLKTALTRGLITGGSDYLTKGALSAFDLSDENAGMLRGLFGGLGDALSKGGGALSALFGGGSDQRSSARPSAASRKTATDSLAPLAMLAMAKKLKDQRGKEEAPKEPVQRALDPWASARMADWAFAPTLA